MEKAKLEISKTKKGEYVASLVFPNGKKQPVPNLKLKDDSLNGKEIEVEREKGQIKKIYYEGKEIYSETESKKAQATKQSKDKIIEQSPSQSTNIYSKAPYNFIPLNEKVVPAEEIPEFDRYCTKRYCTEERIESRFTGYIDIEIKALTPLYIRDTLTEEEYKEKLRIEDENENKKKNKQQKFINPDFFSPGGLPRIPGSSLRGMIRTLVEIMSFGKFGFFDDARLYYRAVGDTSRLGIDYRNKMVDTSNNYFPKFKAGILRAKGSNRYEILPSKVINGTQIYRINFDKRTGIVDGTTEFRLSDFEFKEIYFKPVTPQNHTHYRIDRRTNARIPYQLRYAKLTSVSLTQNNSHPNRGYIISSGHMDKKHMHWVINEPDLSVTPLNLDDDVVKSYKNDSQRNAPDILEKLKEKQEIPCFYLVDQSGKVISFGHTGFFRLAYEKTIGDHIPRELKSPNITDIAEAIFGNEKTHAGRVFFEDAYLDGKPEDALLETAVPKILSNPKPTCFQHYIEQKPENLENPPKNLAHYNSENSIRGYKLYWHRSGLNYEAEEISYDEKDFNKLLSDFKKSKDDFKGYIIEEKNNKIKIDLKNLPQELKAIIIKSIGKYETQHTLLKPINKGAVFRGRIRFENLSKVELGALLFALDLPDGLAHKLGMGKPLGFGSVKITPKLYLSDRMKRYTDLFAEWDGLNDETNRITEFKDEFEKYVLDKLRNSGAIQENINSLWNIERMQHLKAMLDFNNKPNDLETDYLPLDEFKERKVLPKPNEIKNK
jgi:CRISPR-associated protein (TIGR03986 family)